MGGSTNVLSEKLNSRASCCMVSSAIPVASGNTASWFPPKARSLNTSTRTKSNPMAQPTTTSISIAAPSGSAATPIAVRAGYGSAKCSRYASFIDAKSDISVR
jgi:hypothetical protein